MISTFTETELRLIAQLRPLVADILEDEFEETNDFLLIWIRYANHDLIKAEQALRNNKKWRAEYNMDKILLEDTMDFEDDFPFENHAVDIDGIPILTLTAGQVDLKKIVNSPGGKTRLTRFMLKQIEITFQRVKSQYFETNGRVCKFSGVVDMGNFSFSQLTSSKVIQACTDMVRMAESNYPNLTMNLYIVNAPRMIKILMNIIKPFLSADTLSRLRIFDSKKEQWREVLLETIPRDQLPAFAH